MTAKLIVSASLLPNGSIFEVSGRDAWALLELIKAGSKGCTPIDNPGPRWSAYVHALRFERGLQIETVNEAHKGPFPGNHARYILRGAVEVISRNDELEGRAA